MAILFSEEDLKGTDKKVMDIMEVRARNEFVSNRALTPEFEMPEMAPTTTTASALANLGSMALELHEARGCGCAHEA